ncbi:thioesterase family protein [Xylariomycetidae sp. FL0641]|nr:thioesterase family protein [Xylariomycetidae sp. FL0641]
MADASASASANVPDDATIKAHIEDLVATTLPNSAIYQFLLRDVRIAAATRGRVTARLAVTRAHTNSAGGLHGAASAAVVDWAGGLAVATWDLRARTGVSVDIHVRYLAASAREGDELEILATADKVGASVAFTSVLIRKVDGGEVVASGTHTKYVRQRPAGAA